MQDAHKFVVAYPETVALSVGGRINGYTMKHALLMDIADRPKASPRD